MAKFNRAGADQARKAHPTLTVYDTGQMLEPILRGDGVVDFENEESSHVLTVSAYPSALHDDTIMLEIDSDLFWRLKIMVNDGHAVTIDTTGERQFADDPIDDEEGVTHEDH